MDVVTDDDIPVDNNVVLVFHGIDTIATIYLNDHRLGAVNNMFTRYSYDVKSILLSTSSVQKLRIEFVSPIVAAQQLATDNALTPPECPPKPYNGECHMNMLRKMQASFAWDWGLAAPSMGIWYMRAWNY